VPGSQKIQALEGLSPSGAFWVGTGEFRTTGTAENQPVGQDKEVGCQNFHGLADVRDCGIGAGEGDTPGDRLAELAGRKKVT
jgi:hypothetical protein